MLPGTVRRNTGYAKKSLEQDIAKVKRHLKRDDAVIVYDKSTKTSNIVPKDHLEKSQSK
ncbi:YheU family protein [Thermodesulfobacteriota bacterium]